jgi:hypothetical protein
MLRGHIWTLSKLVYLTTRDALKPAIIWAVWLASLYGWAWALSEQ